VGAASASMVGGLFFKTLRNCRSQGASKGLSQHIRLRFRSAQLSSPLKPSRRSHIRMHMSGRNKWAWEIGRWGRGVVVFGEVG
jgi:hypothetical protein